MGICFPVSAQIRADRLRAEVEFLSDSLCAGRESGTPGSSAAAFFVFGRFRDRGLSPEVDCFRLPDSGAGHNVIGRVSSSASSRWIIITAYYDGLGTIGGRIYPGADSNASGVAALLELADTLGSVHGPRRNLLFVALDAHNRSRAGADALWSYLSSRRITAGSIDLVVNLDIIGNNLNPVERCWKDYLIALGASRRASSLEACNSGLGLHLYYDYYGSRSFTDLFYRKAGDQKVFLDHGVPCVMFTAGISGHTNKTSDTPETLNYGLLERRVRLIARWIAGMI